jgi:hypothetical protein
MELTTNRFGLKQRPSHVWFAITLALILTYLGIHPLESVLFAAGWIAAGLLGHLVLRLVFGSVKPRQSVLMSVGPGPLLGLVIAVAVFLAVRGNIAWFFSIIALLSFSLRHIDRLLSRPTTPVESDSSIGVDDIPSKFAILLVGVALIANSRQFPNLLMSGVGILLFAIAVKGWRPTLRNILLTVASAIPVFLDVRNRVDFWWVASDDTPILAGIGEITVERGYIADISGWPTSSHHWLIHVWLALWNNLSFGHIFETYLIVWPLVAACSLVASLWLILETVVGKNLHLWQVAFVALAASGFLRLEWTAPQEQKPFVFAIACCCALFLMRHFPTVERSTKRRAFGLMLLLALPMGLYVLKPSLLVAYGLLLVGTWVVSSGLARGRLVMMGVAVSIFAIVAGISLISVFERFVSQRSFTKIEIVWFTKDLGWCRVGSRPGPESLACVLELQVLLFFVGLVAALAIWIHGRKNPLSVSPLFLMPLVLAYLPFRYLISTDVGSGSPSFYGLSETAVVLVIAIALAALLAGSGLSPALAAVFIVVAAIANVVGKGPGDVYNSVDTVLTQFRYLRFLDSTNVVALFLSVGGAALLSRLGRFRSLSGRYVHLTLGIISFLPMTRIGVENWGVPPLPERESRPAYLGPPEVEDVSVWMQKNTEFGTLFATNYLCQSSRIDDCARDEVNFQCPDQHPVLFASWSLTALSRREFLYLSQGWSEGDYCAYHLESSQLGRSVSLEAISALQTVGVDYYIASRLHSASEAWSILSGFAEYQAGDFLVVSLPRLIDGIEET